MSWIKKQHETTIKETIYQIVLLFSRVMNRQVGVAKPPPDGIMQRGLMIRHLVMPNRVGGTKGVIEWIAENLPRDTYINIMSQYTPVFKAKEYPKIARRITKEEYRETLLWAKKAGLTNVDVQGYPF